MSAETFYVELADDDTLEAPRPIVYAGTSYFAALDAFRAISSSNPGRRYLLSVGTNTRAWALAASDTDNVARLAAGLLPLWQVPAHSYADAMRGAQ